MVINLFLINLVINAQVLIKDSNLVSLSGNISQLPGALNFIAMGDWGRNGADHQKEVAVQMGRIAAKIKSEFIISTGDNFYPSGVISEWDPLWKYSFEDIYKDFSLQWDWYPVLGNHDYRSNPDAEVAYSKISRRWRMPSRYYSKLINIPGEKNAKVLILFLDTNPFIPGYYSNAEYGPKVKAQDTLAQKKWIEDELSVQDTSIKWKIIVGHHPMYTGGGRTDNFDTKAIRYSLLPLLDKYGVDVYLTGHEHSLQHLKANGKTHHFISGAASEKTPVKLIPESKMAASVYGFLSFSLTSHQLAVNAINENGDTFYSYLITKQAN